jgi:hypothetical protein
MRHTMRCDFCGERNPKYKFANPPIRSECFQTVFAPGYFAACVDCAMLAEDGRWTTLAVRALGSPLYGDLILEAGFDVQGELAIIYSKISRTREPF